MLKNPQGLDISFVLRKTEKGRIGENGDKHNRTNTIKAKY